VLFVTNLLVYLHLVKALLAVVAAHLEAPALLVVILALTEGVAQVAAVIPTAELMPVAAAASSSSPMLAVELVEIDMMKKAVVVARAAVVVQEAAVGDVPPRYPPLEVRMRAITASLAARVRRKHRQTPPPMYTIFFGCWLSKNV
jgi:hypothetical protein